MIFGDSVEQVTRAGDALVSENAQATGDAAARAGDQLPAPAEGALDGTMVCSERVEFAD